VPISQSVKVSGGAGPSAGMNVAAGSTIVVVTTGGSGAGYTPTDNVPNTWPASPAINIDMAGARLAVWVLQNAPAKTGYTVSVASAAGDSVFTVHEATGVLAASIDSAATASGTGAEPFTLNAASTLAQANNTVISAMLPYMSGDPVTYACNTGYAIAAQENNNNSFYGQGVASKSVTSTTAPSAQWDTTGATGDVFVGIVVLKEATAGGTNIAPGAGNIAFTGHAPTIAQPHAVEPGAGAVTITGFAPAIAQPHAVAPGAAAVSITGFAPTVAQTQHQLVAPGAAALTIAGFAPGLAQTANQAVAPGAGALAFTGHAPTITQGAAQAIAPAAAAIAITGHVPTVAATAHQALTPAAASIAITGSAPTVAQSGNQAVQPDAAQLTIAGFAPVVARTAAQMLNPGAAAIVITGLAPTVAQGAAGPALPGEVWHVDRRSSVWHEDERSTHAVVDARPADWLAEER